MPQLVEVPEHGLVEFPDHMDDTAIAGAIKSQSSPAASPPTEAPPLTPERSADVQKFLKETPYPADENFSIKDWFTTAPQWVRDSADWAIEHAPTIGRWIDPSGINHLTEQVLGPQEYSGISRGVASGMGHLAEGVVNPMGLATLGLAGAPAAVGRGVAALFTANMVKHLPGAVEAIGEAQNTEDRARAITEALGMGAAAFGAGKHALSRPSISGLPTTGGEFTNAIENKSTAQLDGSLLERGGAQESTGQMPAVGRSEGIHASGQGPEVRTEATGKITQLLNRRQKTTDPVERQRLWDEANALESPKPKTRSFNEIKLDIQKLQSSGSEIPDSLYAELGKASRSILEKTAKISEKIDSKSHSEIENLVERYDAGDDQISTIHDLVNEVEAVASETGNKTALDAVEKFRKSRAEDFKLAGRGDLDQDEAQFLSDLNGPTQMKLGGGESGSLNVDVLKDAVKEYAEGLKEHVKGAGKLAGAAERFIATKEQRDKIPALYDAAENQAGYVANQAKNSVRTEADSPLALKAATFVQQSAGDRTGMTAKLNAIRGKGYDDVIDYVQAHWDDLVPVAAKAQAATDAAHAEALNSGMDLAYREGYVKGAYEQYEPQNRKVVFGQTKGGGGVGTSFRNEKTYNDYAEAIAAGEKPSTLDLADLTQSAVLQSMRAVNRRNWVDALGAMKMPDGKPVTLPPERIPRRDSAGNVASPGLGAPKGYQLVDIGGGMTAVHEDIAPLVDALTSPSKFPKWMAQLAGGVKHNMLAFDIYHGSRFGQMQMAMMRQKTPSFRKGLATMEYADADLAKAVTTGEITQEQADYAVANRPIIEGGIRNGANIGRISDALYKDVAPLLPFAKATTKFIFDKLSRGIITESYVYAFKRNQGLHPGMGTEALHRLTAKEINTYYRNLGSQGVLKNKTFQDTARFMLLAPQWFEGRVTSEAVGAGQLAKSAATLKKPGNVGAAMGTGLVAYYAINQLLNMATRGHPTWDNPEPGHKMDAWVPDPMGSSGQFVSPISVFAETTHDVHKLHERGVSMLDVGENIAGSQLGPVPRTVWDVATGRDFYGQKLHGLDRFTQAAKDIAPVPISLKGQNSAGSGERQALSFAGIKAVGAGTASNNAYKLADAWMRKHDVKRPGAQEGEAGPASIYSPLRQALEVGDMKKARTELKELRKTTNPDLIDKHFSSLDNVRFTGRKSTEDDFIASLRPKEKAIYERAIKERERVMDRYDKLR